MTFVMIAVLGCIGAFYGYRTAGTIGAVVGVAIAAVVGLIAGIVINRITGSAGSVAGGLFSGREAKWSKRELLGSDLSQARHMKKNEKFGKSLKKVNEILEQDPEFPEALLLKAQILWDGYENIPKAKGYLVKVLKVTPESGSLNKEAAGFYKELIRIEKIRNAQDEREA